MKKTKGTVECDFSNLPRLSNGKIDWLNATGYDF